MTCSFNDSIAGPGEQVQSNGEDDHQNNQDREQDDPQNNRDGFFVDFGIFFGW
jgi:hypothetical protein